MRRVVTGSSRLRKQVPMGTPTRAPSTTTAVALRSACFHAFGTSGAEATKSMISKSAATRRGAETGKSACRSRHKGNRADGDRGVVLTSVGDEVGQAHALSMCNMMFCKKSLRVFRPHVRSVPPVLLFTSATILAATASISRSVRVFSRGWIVTAIATDFLPSSMPLPS